MRLQEFLLIPFLLLAALTSCEKNSKSDQTLYLNLKEDPVSLDPRAVRSLKDLTVVKQLYEGLMRLDSSGASKPALAQHVEVTGDGLTYTFYLREAYWSNGDSITAFDFVSSWKEVLNPQFPTDYAYLLYLIKNVEAKDSSTLVVNLEAPLSYFLELVAFPTYFPVNKNDPNACSGPFYLEKWIPQAKLVLKKNPVYWDCSAVQLDGLEFSVIADGNTENFLFEKGQLDWIGPPTSQSIASDLLAHLDKDETLDCYEVAGTCWLKFNTQKEPFDDKRIRQIFSAAINRNQLIEHVLQGKQSVASSPLPPHLSQQSPLDLKEQESLSEILLEKGWTAQTFPKIVLTYASNERTTKLVQQIQEDWRENLGILVELEAQELQVYKSNTKQGFYQVGMGDWVADYNDPTAFLDLFKYSNNSRNGNGMNDCFWQNEEYIALLNAAAKELDPLIRKLKLAQAEEILVKELPAAPLYHYIFEYRKQPYVRDVKVSSLGIADFKEAKIIR